MAAEKAKKTIVIGHKNPDTDSICSAIGYANFKTLQTGGEYVPCRAGELNPETTFVLDYFKVAVPKLIKSVKTQVKDIEIRRDSRCFQEYFPEKSMEPDAGGWSGNTSGCYR